MVNGTFSPKDFAIPAHTVKLFRKQCIVQIRGLGMLPVAIALLPVPEGPAIKIALPATLPSLII
jgi:hypothetical protein